MHSIPKHMIVTMDALPTPPSSTSESEDDEVKHRQSDPKPAVALTEVEIQTEKKPEKRQMSLSDWRRASPCYPNLAAALEDLGFVELSSSPHKNNCLLFSYLLCTEQMTVKDQESKYACSHSGLFSW